MERWEKKWKLNLQNWIKKILTLFECESSHRKWQILHHWYDTYQRYLGFCRMFETNWNKIDGLFVCVIPCSRPTVLYDSLHSGNNIDGLLNWIEKRCHLLCIWWGRKFLIYFSLYFTNSIFLWLTTSDKIIFTLIFNWW